MNTLRKGAEEYLSLRRRLGYKLDRSGRLLLQFVSFMEQQKAPFITSNLVLGWAVLPTKAQPVYWASRLSAVRLFAQYRRATDPRTEVPALGLVRARYQRKRPYLYSEDEIARLMGEAARLASPTGLRAQTYVTLLGLLTVAGLQDQRGDRTRPRGCRSRWRESDGPPDQVREDPTGARTSIDIAGTAPVRTLPRSRSSQTTNEQLSRRRDRCPAGEEHCRRRLCPSISSDWASWPGRSSRAWSASA